MGFGSFNSINPIPDEKPSQQALLGDLTVEPRSIDALIAEQPSASPEEYSETNNAFTQEPVVKPENWISHSIQKGQTLSKILVPYGISQTDINTLVKSSEIAHTLQNIQTGRKLRLLISDSKQLLELEYKRNRTENNQNIQNRQWVYLQYR